MTKIDFYIIPSDSIEQRHLFACRLVEKAYKLNHKVYIHTKDNAQAEQLNTLLWRFRPSSFVPHQLQSNGAFQSDSESCPVIIGYGLCEITKPDVMINLSAEVPDFFSRFMRISEIVIQNPMVTESTRKNYRFYRDRGYPLDSHKLG